MFFVSSNTIANSRQYIEAKLTSDPLIYGKLHVLYVYSTYNYVTIECFMHPFMAINLCQDQNTKNLLEQNFNNNMRQDDY